MSNLIDIMERFTEQELDNILAIMKNKIPNLHMGMLGFVNKDFILDYYKVHLEFIRTSRGGDRTDFATRSTYMKIISKLTNRGYEIKEERSRVVVRLFDDQGLDVDFAVKDRSAARRKAMSFLLGHKVYKKTKQTDKNKFYRSSKKQMRKMVARKLA